MPEFEVVDKLFLELSQVTTATTSKELRLQAHVDAMTNAIKRFVAHVEERKDAGMKAPFDVELQRLKAVAGMR